MNTPRLTRSTCPYCGVGCGVLIESVGDQITGVRGDPDHPANWGKLCTKGSTLAHSASAAIQQQTRLLMPQLRASRDAAPQGIAWAQALDIATSRLSHIVREHGPEAVGVYVSGQLLTEDYYVFNKLVKGVLGTNHIDTNSRLCMSSAVAGYKRTLGADAPPACYEDIDHAATLFIAGSNTAYAHPILFRRIEAAKAARPELKIIVADPRRTDTAASADLHLMLQPGTDVALFHGLLHLMLWEGWIDEAYIAAHTQGFETLKALVRDYHPAHVARVCGLKEADLHTAARWFAGVPDGAGLPLHQRTPTLSLYCQGLNQSSSGTAKNAALINLHLATGQIGKVGAGPFSLTGQPNAMGGREVGGLANLLSAHRDLSNPQHRAEVAALWQMDSVPERPGRTAVEMFQAAADGEIKALWIVCTNPAQSLPDQATVRRALQRAEFVIVQEAYATTATAAYADLLLPATTWGEKDGTVTNSERRISRVRPAITPPTDPHFPHDGPRHDWAIARDIAQGLEQGGLGPTLPAGLASRFDYPTPEAVWNEHRASTQGRDLDITGLSYTMLDTQGPQQWPLRAGESVGQTRLYADGQFPTASGKAQFAADAYQPVAETRNARYPFSLLTGRLRDQWHGMSRTGNLGRLFGHVPEPLLEMHPQDMARRGFHDGDLVQVTSPRGSVLLPIQAQDGLGLGQVYIPMHWGSEFLSGQGADGQPLAGINALTNPAYCPTSKQPELKHAVVRVETTDLPWTLLGLAWLPEGRAHSARRQLMALMPQLAFTTCVPFGRGEQGRSGLLFRAAHAQAPAPELLDQIEAALGLHTPNTLRYVDIKHGQRRAVRLHRPEGHSDRATLEAFLLAGDTRAQAWIKTLLQDELPAQAYGRQLLWASEQPPAALSQLSPRSPQICTCFNVSQTQIEAELTHATGSEGERLAHLQTTLKCGTNCGSCIPQLKQLIRVHPVAA